MNVAQVELMRTIHRFQHFDMSPIFNDTTRGEFFLLEILYKKKQDGQDGCFVSELAEALEVSSPAVSRMLRRLDGRGWTGRQINPGDRRNIRVSIAPPGERQVEETLATFRLFGDRIGRRMGDREMQRLISLWNRLLDIMDEERDTLLKEKQNHA